jgi:hypothetical protein
VEDTNPAKTFFGSNSRKAQLSSQVSSLLPMSVIRSSGPDVVSQIVLVLNIFVDLEGTRSARRNCSGVAEETSQEARRQAG